MTDGQPISRPRRGRPPASEAGLAEERVLDAATALFLEQGFGRTTLDQVSERSRSGKSTLYGRFANKEALFEAVVRRSIAVMFEGVQRPNPDLPVRERVRSVGLELARALLESRCVALMRITAAEAGNFPELATVGYRESFDGAARFVAEAITGQAAGIDDAMPAACRFVELALQPMSFQATFGASSDRLLATADRDIDDALGAIVARGLLKE